MKIGDPLDSSTTVGATISAEHAEKVLGYVESAVKEGAKIACGGKRVILEGLGFFS
jgi:acyl-CoA reductase-like NAD-dependent aldehyde dehydrogenase